jgi:hypothetical protein
MAWAGGDAGQAAVPMNQQGEVQVNMIKTLVSAGMLDVMATPVLAASYPPMAFFITSAGGEEIRGVPP